MNNSTSTQEKNDYSKDGDHVYKNFNETLNMIDTNSDNTFIEINGKRSNYFNLLKNDVS